MRNPRIMQKSATGIAVAVVIAAFAYAAYAAASSRTEKVPAAVDAEQYADFMDNEVWDAEDLAEGAEIQRRMFNRMTPPNFSWLQPMFPSVVPFDAANFAESFLDDLLGEDKNSVAIYPLSLVLDPKTRETLVYNAEGKLIIAIPSDNITRTWPENADPARITLLLDLLPSEDVEPYLYTESRLDEFFSSSSVKSAKSSVPTKRSLGEDDFGICNIQKLTNGNTRLTLTNGADVAEIYAYTVLHTASVVVVTWTNEQSNVVTDTNTLWTPVSPSFDGIESAWESSESNLVLTGGVGVWEDSNISSNDRVRFYAVAKRGDADKDELTDGAEILLHRTDMSDYDTDGDSLLDGYNIVLDELDPRYDQWANSGIIYVENSRLRTFKGELSAGSDPLNEDTDGDTLPDGWEVQNDLDPSDDGTTNSNNGATGDLDGDGFDNRLEYDLGAPANNPAWNGNELAYKLMHATEVVVTNTRSITTNLIGMRVTVEDSWDCVTGGNPDVQNEFDYLDVEPLLECGYYINISVDGSVENVDTNYDKVSFEAFTNTPYFSSHNTDKWPEECDMIGEGATRNVLIMGNSTVKLRYNTAGYKWHSGAYAEIMEATNTGAYKVEITGDSKICEGETTSMGAFGGTGSNYTWNASGGVSVTTNGDVTGTSYGVGTVMATDGNGCTGTKEILVLKADIGSVGPLADRTLHPDAARKPLLLKQTLPATWNGLMELSLSGAVAYWTSTGGVPIASGGVFTNSQLPQTVYLEGDGFGTGSASFSIYGPPGCGTNTSFYVYGLEFSANPVKAGICLDGQNHDLRGTVTATITPVSIANQVTFDSSNPNRATVAEDNRSTQGNSVVVTLKVTGVAETPSTHPSGDADLRALLNGQVLGSTSILVIVPDANTHSAGSITFENIAFTIAGTNLYHPGSRATCYVTTTIQDQFGNTLDSMYDGYHVVTEEFQDIHGGSNFFPAGEVFINVPDGNLQNGVIMDEVGDMYYLGNWVDDISNAPAWVAFTRYIDGTNNNAFSLQLDGNDDRDALQLLRVHGHEVTPSYRRTISTKDANYPPIPFTISDTP